MPLEIQMLLTAFGFYKDRLREVRRDDSGASGIETAIITAVLAGIAITLTVIIVGVITKKGDCIASAKTTCP